jgi:hypothetical protein
VNEFNNHKGDMSIENIVEVEGYILPNPTFVTSFERASENGTLNIK